MLKPLFPDQLADNADRVRPERSCNRYEFDNVEASLAGLEFRDKRLRPFYSLGELLLGKPGVFTGRYQQSPEMGLSPGIDGFPHALVAAMAEREGRSIRF